MRHGDLLTAAARARSVYGRGHGRAHRIAAREPIGSGPCPSQLL
ncbi:hypothetical protein FM106_25135 [Brachybacterium faecium]|nr:hypothetical protein FM106_25135 [Brachybacterium faecium]